MINALTTSLWLVAIACAITLLLRPLVLRYLGPRVQYSLWLFVPLAAMLPWLPSLPQVPTLATQFTVTPELLQNASVYIEKQSFLGLWMWAIGVAAMLIYMLVTTAMFYQHHGMLPWDRGGREQKSLVDSKLVGTFTNVKSPAIVGLWRPKLLIPMNFESLYNTRQQALIVAHEQLHWQRGDLQFNFLAFLLLALNWINPLAWVAYSRYRQDQELACDAAIITQFPNDKKTYAEALLVTSVIDTQTASHFGTPHLNHYGAHPMKQRVAHLSQQRGFQYWPLLTLLAVGMVTWLFLLNPAAANTETLATNVASESPTPIVRINPSYPAQAVEQGLEGRVELRFDINERGETENVWVEITRSNEVFHDAAADALKKWRFHPNDAGTDYRVVLAFELE